LQIDGELRELRIRFATTRYRVFYQRSDNLVVLLHAIEKDTEAVPRGDIDLARQRMADAAAGCGQRRAAREPTTMSHLSKWIN
jgi:phage-related protein